jgi:hypothetical protein
MYTYRKKDEDFGIKQEDYLEQKLLRKYEKVIKLPRFHKYDFYVIDNNVKMFVELKSRRVKIDTYKTTYIGTNKRPNNDMLKSKIKILFVCGFLENQYRYIEYTPDLENNIIVNHNNNGEIRECYNLDIQTMKEL